MASPCEIPRRWVDFISRSAQAEHFTSAPALISHFAVRQNMRLPKNDSFVISCVVQKHYTTFRALAMTSGVAGRVIARLAEQAVAIYTAQTNGFERSRWFLHAGRRGRHPLRILSKVPARGRRNAAPTAGFR